MVDLDMRLAEELQSRQVAVGLAASGIHPVLFLAHLESPLVVADLVKHRSC
jgi:hypothetical protein